jgi:peptide/nickel transport system ATP-binding protein
MNHPLLSIKDLSVQFLQDGQWTQAVNHISIEIRKGSFTAIVGESGSGKSVTALSILRLLTNAARIKGSVQFSPGGEQPVELSRLSQKEINTIRGNRIAMIFQEPMTSLNPLFSCGYQVMEVVRRHQKCSRKAAREKTIELFKQVELPEPAAMYHRYPHQVSGGQKQRVMIAMAISCNPSLLIADEPTTALDVSVQQHILALLKKLQIEFGMSVLLISHDLGLVADTADEIYVMYKGEIVEKGNAGNVLNNPQHPYTKGLLACRPVAGSKGKKLPVPDEYLFPNEAFAEIHSRREPAIIPSTEPALTVQHLKVYFPAAVNFFGKTTRYVKAVDDVSFTVMKNETVGLVGESGCGKTTLGRAILQLVQPTSGNILLGEKEISGFTAKELRSARKELQIVFQDPYGSLNPRLTIGEAITEPMKVHGLYQNSRERKDKAAELLQQVRLNADHYNRYPHQFSGGQRQRICIARALALQPRLLIFDESVSALDLGVQAQVLNIINELKSSYDFTSVFISHDLAVVHYISDRILVMQNGRIVEEGTADKILHHPENVYTQDLIAAIPGKNLPAIL